MRAVVQRVVSSSVNVDGKTIAEIGRGLLILVGIHREDADSDIEFVARKLLNTRFFDGENDKRWATSFTLYHIQKGYKPDFHLAMGPNDAPIVYDKLIDRLGKLYKPEKIKSGEFGAYMNVNISNDGPVTLIFDSRSPKGGDFPEESTTNGS